MPPDEESKGGALLGHALELIRKAHNLVTLELDFESKDFFQIFDSLFSPNRTMLSQLQQFRGLKELKIVKQGRSSIPSEEYSKNPNFVQTKAIMESEDPESQQEWDMQVDGATRYGFYYKPTNQLLPRSYWPLVIV